MSQGLFFLATIAALCLGPRAETRPPKRATAMPKPSAEGILAEKIADGLVDVLNGRTRFRLDACPVVTPTQWASLLLLNDGIPMKYAFVDGCDVEGDVVLRRDPFALDLKLRNFINADRLRATVDAEAKPDWSNGLVRAEVRFRDATIEGAKAGWGAPVFFTAALRVSTGLADPKQSELQGELRIYRVRGQAVDVRRKFP